MTFALGFVTAFVCGLVLASFWRRMGWGDAPSDAEASRKLQRSAVPAVGGLAILGGWAAQFTISGRAVFEGLGAGLPGYADELEGDRALAGAAAALLIAFAVGWLDDWRRSGLNPLAKSVGQALAGAALALPILLPGGAGDAPDALAGLGWCAAYAAAGWVACNALNTFDNADGAAAAVSAGGLLAVGSTLGAAVLGFLAVNLFGRLREGAAKFHLPRGGGEVDLGEPVVFMGDAGSHLLGVLALVVPGAWPLLWLPLLDMVRVACVRLRRGLRPWSGDRRHLAHRLQRLGLSRLVVVVVLVAISAPAIAWPQISGLGLSAALFALAVLYSRAAAEEPPAA